MSNDLFLEMIKIVMIDEIMTPNMPSIRPDNKIAILNNLNAIINLWLDVNA